MANTVTSLKRIRITERRTAINRARKSRIKGAIKVMRKFLADKNLDEATKQLRTVFSVVDRGAKQGVIKKNTAARYKSRLAHRLKAIAA
jgi:small subunit ribosomal protein S20